MVSVASNESFVTDGRTSGRSARVAYTEVGPHTTSTVASVKRSVRSPLGIDGACGR